MASAELTPLVAGNWKMNGLAVSEGELAKIVNGAAGFKADLMVCPPATLVASFAAAARGSAVAIDFSRDREQRLMFVINQNNSRIEIMERGSGKVLGNFGRPGPYPGEFNQAHGLAIDSQGSIYVNENRGRRTQKFKLVGG